MSLQYVIKLSVFKEIDKQECVHMTFITTLLHLVLIRSHSLLIF